MDAVLVLAWFWHHLWGSLGSCDGARRARDRPAFGAYDGLLLFAKLPGYRVIVAIASSKGRGIRRKYYGRVGFGSTVGRPSSRGGRPVVERKGPYRHNRWRAVCPSVACQGHGLSVCSRAAALLGGVGGALCPRQG